MYLWPLFAAIDHNSDIDEDDNRYDLREPQPVFAKPASNQRRMRRLLRLNPPRYIHGLGTGSIQPP